MKLSLFLTPVRPPLQKTRPLLQQRVRAIRTTRRQLPYAADRCIYPEHVIIPAPHRAVPVREARDTLRGRTEGTLPGRIRPDRGQARARSRRAEKTQDPDSVPVDTRETDRARDSHATVVTVVTAATYAKEQDALREAAGSDSPDAEEAPLYRQLTRPLPSRNRAAITPESSSTRAKRTRKRPRNQSANATLPEAAAARSNTEKSATSSEPRSASMTFTRIIIMPATIPTIRTLRSVRPGPAARMQSRRRTRELLSSRQWRLRTSRFPIL